MTSKNIRFRVNQDAEAIMSDLAEIAASLGLLNQRGGGDIAGLLEHIATGDAVILPTAYLDDLFDIAIRFEMMGVDELLSSIVTGNVAVWHYPDTDHLWMMIGHLETASAYDGDAYSELALALRDAARRTNESEE